MSSFLIYMFVILVVVVVEEDLVLDLCADKKKKNKKKSSPGSESNTRSLDRNYIKLFFGTAVLISYSLMLYQLSYRETIAGDGISLIFQKKTRYKTNQ